MSTASEIADLILRRGQIAGQGAANQGAIWGGTLRDLGQTVAAIPTYLQNEQARQQENQLRTGQLGLQQQEMGIRQAELQQHQRQQAAEDALNNAYSKALKPDGSVDNDVLAQSLAGTPAAAQWPTIQEHLAKSRQTGLEIQKLQGEVQEKERDQIAALGNAADTADTTDHKAGILLHGLADKSISRENAIPLIAAMLDANGNPTDEGVASVIARMKQFSPSDVEKRAQAAKAAVEATNAAAQLLGIQARTAVEQQVAAGTQGGLTPEQQQAAKDRAAALAQTGTNQALTRQQEAQRIGLETQRVGLERQRLAQGEAGVNPALAANVPDVAPGQKNEDFLKTLSPPIASQVKALADGRMAFPSGFALRSPYWQNLLQAVAKYDPSFDAVNYNARAKTRADFTSGKAAQQVNAINTVIGHLSNLSDAAEALHNSDIPTFNQLANLVSRATGSPKVTNFDTIKKAVSDEVTRVWRQSGGSERDIEAAQKNLDASGSPAQLRGAIATYADLLQSKLGSLNEQYRQGMGTDKVDMVTPAAAQTLQKLEQRAGRQPAQAQPTTAPRYQVGDKVNYRGQQKTVTAVHPDGTLELK